MSVMGIDIGGANLKIVIGDFAEISYFPMWKKASELGAILKEIKDRFHPDKVGVVITAELSDCFRNREDGMRYISGVVKTSFSPSPSYFLDLTGNLSGNILQPENYFASNWVASSKFLLLDGWDDFIFADMGSTTTDLIPVKKDILARKTDFERLSKGELLYFGILRTPVFYLLSEFGAPLVPEYFAITADCFRITGDITEEEYNCDTPDSKGKSKEECMLRLARTVCLEPEKDFILEFAKSVREKMIEKLQKSLEDHSERFSIERVLGCGTGEFLIEKASRKAGLEYVSLAKEYKFSEMFPAFAISELVKRNFSANRDEDR